MYKFHYFGDRGKARTNVITVATFREPGSDIIKFSFACSNAMDIYDKNLGKKKALSRLQSNSQVFQLQLDAELIKYKTVNNYLANFILDNKDSFPSWVKLVVQRNAKLDKTSEENI